MRVLYDALQAELRMAVASCLLLLVVLLLSGAVVYKYFADQDEWTGAPPQPRH